MNRNLTGLNEKAEEINTKTIDDSNGGRVDVESEEKNQD